MHHNKNKNMAYKKLIIFDFDKTLFNTPEPEEGRIIWKNKMGYDFPYRGWWSKSETIDPSIFNITLNKWVYQKYLEAVSDLNNYVILVTGRLSNIPGMIEHIHTLLDKNNITFNEIKLSSGGSTYFFKINLFKKRINDKLIFPNGCDELIIYDDRSEHITNFKEWAETQDINIKIVDVLNKKETIFKK